MSVMIARFDGVTDVSAGKAIKVSWPALVERLSKFEKSENKKSVGGWTPAIFRPFCECGEDSCPGERGHRTNGNVLEVYALAFDLDKTRDGEPLDQAYADAALERLNELGLQYVVHTTHSHSPPANVSLRVVVAISRPVSGLEWERFWAAAVNYIDIHVEPACRNLGRFWFLPSSKPGAEPWSRSVDGKPLDVNALLAAASPTASSPTPTPTNGFYRESQFDSSAFRSLILRYQPSAREKQRGGLITFDITCPWESQHTSKSAKDTVVSFGSKGPGFSCLHSHCVHRHWQDFRSEIDPVYADWRANGFKATPEWIEKQRRENPRPERFARGTDPEPTTEQPPAERLDPVAKDELKEKREKKKKKPPAEHEFGSQTGHPGVGPNGGYKLTDLGNGKRFADVHANRLRYVKNWNQWLAWDGKRWRKDELSEEQRAAKEIVTMLYADTAQAVARQAKAINGGTATQGAPIEEMLKWAKDSSKVARLDAMLKAARSEPELATTSSVWDADVWLLNVSNGTIDLRTGEIQPHAQRDMLTKLAPFEYDPAATCPRFEKFLARVQPDEEIRAYIQRYLGYALTGDVREQCLAFFYGTGSNGKSVLLDVLLKIMGDYGLRAAPDLVLAKHGEAHPTELADLEGKRLVVCSEIEQGRTWAEALIKRITGDNTITARKMKQDFYTFPTTHKLVVAANTRPSVRGTDHGIWRRMRLVPWVVTIPDAEQDKTLPDRLLQDEGPGILAWLVRGCLGWQNRGLGSARAIDEATVAYREEQDALGQWIEDRCESGEWVSQKDAYEDYKAWCEAEHVEPWQRKTFKARLLERGGVTEGRELLNTVRVFRFIQLRTANRNGAPQ